MKRGGECGRVAAMAASSYKVEALFAKLKQQIKLRRTCDDYGIGGAVPPRGHGPKSEGLARHRGQKRSQELSTI